jgi:hypothetical protein
MEFSAFQEAKNLVKSHSKAKIKPLEDCTLDYRYSFQQKRIKSMWQKNKISQILNEDGFKFCYLMLLNNWVFRGGFKQIVDIQGCKNMWIFLTSESIIFPFLKKSTRISRINLQILNWNLP